jgi:hypothetical protein
MHGYWMLADDLTGRSVIPQLLFSISFSFHFFFFFWSIDSPGLVIQLESEIFSDVYNVYAQARPNILHWQLNIHESVVM